MDNYHFPIQEARQIDKGSNSKFTILFCSDNDHKNTVAFEGFLNFLSYKTVLHAGRKLPESQTSFLILNSLSVFAISKSWIRRHQSVGLFLDCEKAGINIPKIITVKNKFYGL